MLRARFLASDPLLCEQVRRGTARSENTRFGKRQPPKRKAGPAGNAHAGTANGAGIPNGTVQRGGGNIRLATGKGDPGPGGGGRQGPYGTTGAQCEKRLARAGSLGGAADGSRAVLVAARCACSSMKAARALASARICSRRRCASWGHLPAVGLSVGHAAFRGLLRLGQDAHGPHRGTGRRCSRRGRWAARATGSAGTPERAAAVIAAVPPAATGAAVAAGIAVATLAVAAGPTPCEGTSVAAGIAVATLAADGASARKAPGARATVTRGPWEPAAAPGRGCRAAGRPQPGHSWPGGDPPAPPLRSAPARWYFADTPALAEAFGPGSLAGDERLAVTRRGSRRQHRRDLTFF